MKGPKQGKTKRVERVELRNVDRQCSERNAWSLPAPREGSAPIVYECEGPTGFRLKVSPNNHRVYYLIYRARSTGKSRAHKIGPAADLSFKEALVKAETLRGLVAQGRDPFAEELEARIAATNNRPETVRDCISYYLASHKSLDPKTVLAHQQTRDALPRRFMDSPAEGVTPVAFRAAVKEATNAPIMQNRHLGRLKAALRFAHSEQKIRALPPLVAMKKPNPERPSDRVLATDEIRALWPALGAIAPTMPRGGAAFAASVKLMLLLGTRLGETSLAAWTEIDLEGAKPRSEAVPKRTAVWYVPAEHRKGKRDDLWIPLPPLAVDILRGLLPVTGEKLRVFDKAGYDSRTYMLGKLLDAMKERGQGDRWTYHDLRRTCQTGLAELGCPDWLANLITGHAKKGMVSVYDRSQRMAERAEWLNRWADRVSEIVGLKRESSPTVLHVYVTPAGLPEIKATREPDQGRRYVGGFPPLEAIRKAEEITRAGATRRV